MELSNFYVLVSASLSTIYFFTIPNILPVGTQTRTLKEIACAIIISTTAKKGPSALSRTATFQNIPSRQCAIIEDDPKIRLHRGGAPNL